MGANKTATTKKEEMTLRDLLLIVKSHLIVVCCICIVFGAAGFVYTRMQKPVYQAEGTVMLQSNNESGNASTNSYSMSYYLASSYIDLLKDWSVCNKAAVDLLENQAVPATNVNQLTKMIQSNIAIERSNENSLVLKIRYTSLNKTEAVVITNYYMESAREYIGKKISDETNLTENWMSVNLIIFAEATDSNVKTVSHTMRNMAVFLAAGALVSVAYIALRELFGMRFKNSSDVEKVLGIPVLASVPYYDVEGVTTGGKKS